MVCLVVSTGLHWRRRRPPGSAAAPRRWALGRPRPTTGSPGPTSQADHGRRDPPPSRQGSAAAGGGHRGRGARGSRWGAAARRRLEGSAQHREIRDEGVHGVPGLGGAVLGGVRRLRRGRAGDVRPGAFDRGGLVAVNPADRPAYAATLARLVAPRGRVLLVAVEHPPFKNGSLGPPFNVGPEEVMALFEGNFEVELLRREDRLPLESVWAKRGCSFFNEATYLLTRKAGEDQRTAATKLA